MVDALAVCAGTSATDRGEVGDALRRHQNLHSVAGRSEGRRLEKWVPKESHFFVFVERHTAGCVWHRGPGDTGVEPVFPLIPAAVLAGRTPVPPRTVPR